MRLIFLLATLSSCVRSAEVVCADGRICPPGNTCDDVNQRCLSPEQLAACAALVDGDDCTFAGVPGTCSGGACEPLLCGDGVRTGTEACDGSDLGSADCTTAGYYAPAGLACTPFCTFDTNGCVGRCGDGVINGPELCDGAPPDGTCMDDGFDAGPLGCSGSCGASHDECARFGWAAEPIALAQSFAISGTSPTDVWAVGNLATALHYDGGAWTAVPTGLPTTTTLTGVWTIAPDDAWTVGGTSVAHWDGTQWTAVAGVPPASYVDVWAASATAVYVATAGAGVLAWDGATWQPLGTYTGGAIVEIRGTTASDAWAADASTLWHWNGATWTAALSARISSISAVAADDVWVVGSIGASFDSLIAHWDGQSWTQWTSTLTSLYFGVTADAPNDVWVTGTGGTLFHFDGTAWTETASVTPPNRMPPAYFANFGPGSVLALSSDGVAYHYRGQAYVAFDPSASTIAELLWMDSGDDVFIADSPGHILHYDGATWTGASTVVDPTITTLFGTGPDNVWAGGHAGGIYRYSSAAGTWSLVSTQSIGPLIWGTGPSDMWVFSGNGGEHYNGATWQSYTFATLQVVAGSGSNDIWGVAAGALWHWDGTSWSSSVPSPSPSLVGLVAPAPGHLVAIDASYAYTWDGTSWTSQLLPVVQGAKLIAGTAADNIVVASPAELAQFDGSRWSPVRLPPEASDNPSASINALVATPNMDAILLNLTTRPFVVRALLRTRPWVCEATETDCTNGVDDDCDGKIDGLDSDCP